MRWRVLIGVVVVAFGVVGWLAAAAGAFSFTSAPGSPYVVGGPPVSSAVGDFNGDGLADFVVVGIAPLSLPSFASVWLADGNGGFRSAGEIPVGGGSVAVGDVNGDGKPDLVAATRTGVTVLLGDGDGTFRSAPGSPISLGCYPVQVVVGALTRDGTPDLAALCSSDMVFVLLGNGDGTFTPAAGSPITLGPGAPGAIAAARLTSDANLDLAVTNETLGTVSILRGGGDGTFTPAAGSPIAVGGMPSDLAVADLTGNGRLDLAVANAPTGGLTVLLGRGDGTFSPAPDSPIVLGGQRLSGLAAADFNDDGKPDIAVGRDSGGMDLLLGDGSGGLTPAHGSPFGQGAAVLASGVFDGRTGVIANSPVVDGVSLLLAPLPSDGPMAALAVRAKGVVAGQRIELDASGSSDPLDRKIVDYRWDLGTGRFDHDTGANPTLRTTFQTTGTVHVRVRVTNTAAETATATVRLLVHAPSRNALVTGYVQVCTGRHHRGCSKHAVRICHPAARCVISDRVAAVNAAGRIVATQKLKRGRFRLRLTPGRYSIKLLGDGKRAHRRALQQRKVTARANHTTTVRFSFALPQRARG